MSELETAVQEPEVEVNPLADLVDAALAKDYNKANEIFGSAISVKLSDVMDQERIKVSGVIFRMPSDQLLIIWHKTLPSLPCIHSAPFINSAMSSTIGLWQAFCFNVTGSIRPMSMPLTAS